MMYLLLNTLLVLAASATVAQGSIVAGYAPSWKNMTDVDLSQYTHINLAYAEPLANGSFVMEASYNVSEFASKIQKSGGQPLLALGGWSGSIYFSDILKSTEYRKRLITGIVKNLRDNKLAGVDIDWVANECNKLDVYNDAANLLIFLKELRSELESAFSDAKKVVALGVGMTPFLGPEGPLKDVSEYAKLVDYINVLAYDVNGPYGDSTGPNAPLKFQEGKGAQASLASAIDGWTEAKFPASQMTAGLAFYGRAATAKSDMAAQSWNMYQSREAEIPRGDNDDGLWTDRCNSKPPHFSGVWSYSSLLKQGVLEGAEISKAPWQRYWDNSTTTPWLYNPDSKQFISYDDPPSITAKANYVFEQGLAGVSVFDITMDHNGELIAAVRKVITTGSTPPTSSHKQDTQTSSESSSTFSSSSANSGSTPPTSSHKQDTQVSSESSSTSSSSSANSGSVSSTTASAESTLSPDNHNNESTSPRSGGNCGNKLQYRCMKEDGKDSEFAVCSAGVWISQHCGTGTTCVQSGDYIYCDWPR